MEPNPHPDDAPDSADPLEFEHECRLRLLTIAPGREAVDRVDLQRRFVSAIVQRRAPYVTSISDMNWNDCATVLRMSGEIR